MSKLIVPKGHKVAWTGTCGVIPVQAEAGSDEEKKSAVGIVGGVAIKFGQIGWPQGFWGPTAVEAGAFTNSIISKAGSATRDILFLKAHDSAAVLASTGEGTLELKLEGDELLYRAELDLEDPEALSVYMKIAKRRYKAASVGYGIMDGEYRMAVDDSVDSVTGDEETDVYFSSEAELYEISALAHGAFTSATTKLVAAADGSVTIAGQRYVLATEEEDRESNLESSETATVSEGTQITLAEARAELHEIGVL